MQNNQLPGPRVGMDFTLPLWGVLTAIGAGFTMLVGLFFNVAALTNSVKDLQITVQAGNTAYSSLASRATLLEFRVQDNSDELKRLNAQQNEKDRK